VPTPQPHRKPQQRSWVDRLLRFVRRKLGLEKPRTFPVIHTELQSGRLGTIRIIRRPQIPSAVSAHKFTPSYRQDVEYLLTCDRYYLRRGHVSKGVRFDFSAGRHIETPGHPAPSHIIALTEIKIIPDPNTGKHGTLILFAYPVDFDGIKGALVGSNWYAIKIEGKIAGEFFLKPVSGIDWEAAIHHWAEQLVGSNHEFLIDAKR
jgi:hypothetical protein